MPRGARNTKIVATLGPATRSPEGIAELIRAGADVLRLNFSHGTHDEHATAIERIRTAAERAGRVVGILQDLSGPKIRTSRLANGGPLELRPGEPLRIVSGEGIGGPGQIYTPYKALASSVRPGTTLLLDDGRIELRVDRTDGREIETRVVVGGPLGEHKGISAPGVHLPASSITAKDREDLRFGLEHGVDFVALSFVRSADDLREARAATTAAGHPEVPLVAKIERPEALGNLAAILDHTDVVMVARGDLGLEMSLEQVPRVQREITLLARARGVPVIIATQVLESMRTEPRPTRAEVSDAATAAMEADAIMLSGETAVGSYPARAVATLDAIAREAEGTPAGIGAGSPSDAVLPPFPAAMSSGRGRSDTPTHNRALCEAAVTLAVRASARAIVAPTRTGHTARMLAALRSDIPIVAATPDAGVARRLLCHRGVHPAIVAETTEADTMGESIERQLVASRALEPGNIVVFVNANPDLDRPGANFLGVRRVKG